MKVFVLLALFSPLVLCYDAKYDDVHIDKLLADEDQFNAFMNCMLEKGPCSVEAWAEFRKILPEITATACEKCSDIQKQGVRNAMKAFKERKPAEFAEFKTKYDPKGEYEQKFTAFMSES